LARPAKTSRNEPIRTARPTQRIADAEIKAHPTTRSTRSNRRRAATVGNYWGYRASTVRGLRMSARPPVETATAERPHGRAMYRVTASWVREHLARWGRQARGVDQARDPTGAELMHRRHSRAISYGGRTRSAPRQRSDNGRRQNCPAGGNLGAG